MSVACHRQFNSICTGITFEGIHWDFPYSFSLNYFRLIVYLPFQWILFFKFECVSQDSLRPFSYRFDWKIPLNQSSPAKFLSKSSKLLFFLFFPSFFSTTWLWVINNPNWVFESVKLHNFNTYLKNERITNQLMKRLTHEKKHNAYEQNHQNSIPLRMGYLQQA